MAHSSAIPPCSTPCGRRRSGSATLHLLGLIGPGGVHAQDTHLLALLRLAKQEGLTNVAIHAFLDGRDTPPESARGYMRQLEAGIGQIGVGRVATVSGRYYAMDRDKRWDRVQKAYDALTLGVGETAQTPDEAIARSYAAGVTDEFVLPTVIVGADGAPIGTIDGWRCGDLLQLPLRPCPRTLARACGRAVRRLSSASPTHRSPS